MKIRMSIRKDACQVLGQDSQSSKLLKEEPQNAFLCPVEDWRKFKQLPNLRVCVLKCWPQLEKPLKREKQEMAIEKPELDVFEDRKAFISLIREMENLKKRSKVRGESWKFQWLPPCHARKERRNNVRSGKLKRKVVNPTRFLKHSMHVSLRRMSLRDNVWNDSYRKLMKITYRKIMKITSQAKGTIRWLVTIRFITLSICRRRWTLWMQKQQWSSNGRSLRQFWPGSWTRSKATRRLCWKHKETKTKFTLLH